MQQKVATRVSGMEPTTSGRGERNVSSPDRSYAVCLLGAILHGDHDRGCDPSRLTTREAAYALVIGAIANVMFVVCATAMFVVGAMLPLRTARRRK